MRLNKISVTLAFVALCFGLDSAAFADKVDDLVAAQMAERHIPGAAIAVLQKGKVVKIKGYGVASLEFGVPVTPDTAFEIGSVSKQMTAAGIMLLVQDGKITLDERISKYLPNTPEAWKDVTVRHLLTHTSGVKSYTSLDGFGLIKRMKVADFIKALSPYPLEFTPGERNIYSNSGFSLLAYIIESASGKQYMDFMRERIFQPLGMTRCADRDPLIIIPNRATGYEWTGDRYTGRSWDLTDLKGAGTIVCTIRDMVRWDEALRGTAFLSPASRAEIWKNYVFNSGKPSPYGFGWRISEVRAHKLIGHTGQTAGFASANFRYVDQDVAVVVLTNTGASGVGGMIASGIAKLYIPSMSLRAVKAVPEPNGERIQMVQNAILARYNKQLDSRLMSDQLVKDLSTDRSKREDQRIAGFGPLKTLIFTGQETVDGKQLFRYLEDTGKRMFLWRVSFGDDGRITEMSLEEEE